MKSDPTSWKPTMILLVLSTALLWPELAFAGPPNIPPGIEARLELQAEELIRISETYVDALTVPGNDGVLLHPDVVRWTQQNYADPPRNDDRDELLESIAEEDLDGGIVNRRWTVDVVRQETFMIADIVLTGLPMPIILYERFLIDDGLIREIEAIYLNPNL